MARWEPNARVRLVQAALDVFAEHGYEVSTVNQIADRAGLTKTTFFRHFADKREVLFAGQEEHAQILAIAAAAAPAAASPLEIAGLAVAALADTFTEDRREFSARLRSVLAASRELQERAVFKRATLAASLGTALRARGVPEPNASLAAELGIRAFYEAFEQWADVADQHTLTELTAGLLDRYFAVTALLDKPTG